LERLATRQHGSNIETLLRGSLKVLRQNGRLGRFLYQPVCCTWCTLFHGELGKHNDDFCASKSFIHTKEFEDLDAKLGPD